jgi:itaconate CoA-transferase
MAVTARPLDGVTVVSLEQAIAAPYCTRLLADLGARVIKIERPGTGDFARAYDTRANGLASHFVWCNRSKESVALDLKKPGAVDAVKALLRTADVFVQNLAPGAAGRMGLGGEDLRVLNPQLIVCNISGYGAGGAWSQRKAYDLLIQAEAGFLSITGPRDEPAKAGISIADISAGVSAANAILAALVLRARTHEGTTLDISMLETMAEWMGYPLYYAYEGAPPPPRAGAGHATIYPYGPYRTADGTVLFGLQNDREWKAFASLALRRQSRPQRAPRRHRARHRRDVRPVGHAGGDRAAGKRRHRHGAGQRDGRCLGPSATARARALDDDRLAGGRAEGAAPDLRGSVGAAHGPGSGAGGGHRQGAGRDRPVAGGNRAHLHMSARRSGMALASSRMERNRS